MDFLIGVMLLFVFLFLGMPVGFALGASGAVGILAAGGYQSLLSFLSTTPFRTAASFTLSTIPLFIFMAEILAQGRFTKDLYRVAYQWIGHVPGGLAISSVLASALMGTMSGSTTATASAISKIAIPEMDRYGYHSMLSTGSVALGGTLAILIPPSIPLVLYGILTETSVGQLLIAGILPGILSAVILSVGIYLIARIRPDWVSDFQRFSWKERFRSLSSLWSIGVIILLVIVSIYAGIATATESAALGATGAIVMSLVTKRVRMKDILEAMKSTVETTSMIFTIIIGAMIFSYYFTITGATQQIVNGISSIPAPPMIILLLILGIFLILGFFMDTLVIKLLMIPLTFPVVDALGFDPVWYGILVVIVCEIGLVTPPLGMNVFIVSSVSKVPLETVFKGAGIMLIFEAVILALVLLFPEIALWLPSTMRQH